VLLWARVHFLYLCAFLLRLPYFSGPNCRAVESNGHHETGLDLKGIIFNRHSLYSRIIKAQSHLYRALWSVVSILILFLFALTIRSIKLLYILIFGIYDYAFQMYLYNEIDCTFVLFLTDFFFSCCMWFCTYRATTMCFLCQSYGWWPICSSAQLPKKTRGRFTFTSGMNYTSFQGKKIRLSRKIGP